MTVDGEKIKAWITKSAFSRNAFADHIGVSRDTMNHILGGHRPRITTLMRIALVMECTVDELLSPKDIPLKATSRLSPKVGLYIPKGKRLGKTLAKT